MPPKTPKTPKPEETCSHGECLQLMEKMIENLSKLIKETYEKQMEVLQAEIFSLKKEVDIEKMRRKRLEEKTTGLQDDVKVLNASMNFTLNKLDDHEQEKRSCDIIIDNLDDITEVRDASQHVCQVVNSALMGTIIEKSDIKNTKIIKNKFKKHKMTIITTLSSEANKRAILSQKKLFRAKNIYVKENLTPQRYQLFKEARSFAAQNNYKYTWTRDGNIYLRKIDNSNVIHVRCSTDLDGLAHTHCE